MIVIISFQDNALHIEPEAEKYFIFYLKKLFTAGMGMKR